MWKYYALLSALFAALTAICAKIGVKDINSNLATAIRTSIILAFFLLKEPVNIKVIIGALLITAGSLCMLWKQKQRIQTKKAKDLKMFKHKY